MNDKNMKNVSNQIVYNFISSQLNHTEIEIRLLSRKINQLVTEQTELKRGRRKLLEVRRALIDKDNGDD